jgi:hypothetical protein
MTIRIYFLLALIVAATSCVEEFQPELDEFENLLVIDGNISNEEGPYTIKLSISSGLEIIAPEPVEAATVTIVEENGVSEILTEINPGTYQTAVGGIKGIIGNNYKLLISTNGNQYESEYELLKAPTPIESVEAAVEYRAFPDAPEEVAGYQFYINSATSPYEQDYYLWTMEGTYKYKSSLLIYYVFEGTLKEFDDIDSLETCYRTYRIGEVYTANTDNLLVPKVSAQPLHFLPATDKKLTIRYSMLTKQYSVSKNAYDFWHSIEQQSSNGGSLYSAQPYQIKGNLKNINDPDEPVLGYFTVAGVSENRVFVNKPEGVDIYIPDCALDYMGFPYIFATTASEWPIYVTQGDGGGLAISTPGCMDCRKVGGILAAPEFWIE